jgi:hypothetical protein
VSDLSRVLLLILGLASTRRRGVVLGCVGFLLLSGPAWAQRQLPKDAHFGEITRFAYPLVRIADRTFHMAPGAKIYNQQNLIIMPAAMPPRAKVLFKLDTAGELSAVWLLTAEEAARYRKSTTLPTKPSADQGPGR